MFYKISSNWPKDVSGVINSSTLKIIIPLTLFAQFDEIQCQFHFRFQTRRHYTCSEQCCACCQCCDDYKYMDINDKLAGNMGSLDYMYGMIAYKELEGNLQNFCGFCRKLKEYFAKICRNSADFFLLCTIMEAASKRWLRIEHKITSVHSFKLD